MLSLLVFCCGLISSADAQSTFQNFPAFEDLPEHPELPAAEVMLSGEKVSFPEQWPARRKELKQLFQHYVYGYLPPAPAYQDLTFVKRAKVLEGQAELIELDYVVGPSAEQTITMHFTIVRPLNVTKPVPVVLGLNRCGNHTILDTEEIRTFEYDWVLSGCRDAERGRQTDYWSIPLLIERGYAFATCYVSDIDPDKNDFTDGVHPLYEDWFDEQNIPAAHRWGTLAAWAWGLHRGVDLLEQIPEIDAKKIAVIGHSRRGKAALFAAAMDDRIALAIPHQSGTGGMALSRNNDQETVERINRVFPHWFCGQFKAFDNQEQKLPVDQHLLIALVAPRPLLETSGLQDTWANFESSFRGIQAASPVYEKLGKVGLKGKRPFTADDTINAETTGNLLQYRLPTKHVLVREYWLGILDFADRHFQQ